MVDVIEDVHTSGDPVRVIRLALINAGMQKKVCPEILTAVATIDEHIRDIAKSF